MRFVVLLLLSVALGDGYSRKGTGPVGRRVVDGAGGGWRVAVEDDMLRGLGTDVGGLVVLARVTVNDNKGNLSILERLEAPR